MQLVNISRKTAENFPFLIDQRDWLISIHSSDGSPANIKAPFGKVFPFLFDDIDGDENFAITPKQAMEIANIIREAEAADIRRLWIHCDAGVCRSGAIVEAAKLLGHAPDDEISNQRIPNMLVFNEIRKALGFRHSWEEPPSLEV